MRIQFDNSIRLCTKITLSGKILLVTNSNGVYTVNIGCDKQASIIYDYILEYGYYDLSDYEYSNY